MSSFWQNLVSTLGAPVTNTASKVQGMQTQVAQQKQNLSQQQQKQDQDFVQTNLDHGARIVHAGMVKDDNFQDPNAATGADPVSDDAKAAQGPAPQIAPYILRKADTSRVVTRKMTDGTQVQFELPTPEEQNARSLHQQYINRFSPEAQQMVTQGDIDAANRAGAVAGATAGATETGRQRALATSRQENGVDIQNPGGSGTTRVLPEEVGSVASGLTTAADAAQLVRQKQIAEASQGLGGVMTPGAYKLLHGTYSRQFGPDVMARFDKPEDFDPRISPLHARMQAMTPGDQQKFSMLATMSPADWSDRVDKILPATGSSKGLNIAAHSAVDGYLKRGEYDKADAFVKDLFDQQQKNQGAVDVARNTAPIKIDVGGAIARATANAQAQVAQSTPGLGGPTAAPAAGGGGQTGPGGAPAQTTPAAAPAANPNPHGDEYLKRLNPAFGAGVRAIAEGRDAMPEGRAATSGPGALMRQAVYQYDPDFSAQRAQTRKQFASDKNIQALNTAAAHLDQLGEAAKALNNGSFVPGNAIWNDIKQTFGSSAPTNFSAVQAAVASEMASALKGNATDPEIAAMRENVAKAGSPQQLAGVVDTNLHLISQKLNEKNEAYHQYIPGDQVWSPVHPTARGVFDKHGITLASEAHRAPAGAAPAAGAGFKATMMDSKGLPIGINAKTNRWEHADGTPAN